MTAASNQEATELANMLVNSKLAACVQILPQIESIYRWKGSVERSSEVLLIAKTEQGRFAELEQQVRSRHSYDIPEIVAIPAAEISAPYRKWLSESLAESD
jgi:periplasmic divalent cation tolerance protein